MPGMRETRILWPAGMNGQKDTQFLMYRTSIFEVDKLKEGSYFPHSVDDGEVTLATVQYTSQP
jgi:hypothetical protein